MKQMMSPVMRIMTLKTGKMADLRKDTAQRGEILKAGRCLHNRDYVLQ